MVVVVDIKEVIGVEGVVAAALEVVVEEMVAAEMEIGVVLTLGNYCINLMIYSFPVCVMKLDSLLKFLEVYFEVVYDRNCLYIVVGT